MPLSPGTRLGPYEVLAPLGAGGMGEVYRARDTRLDREVAVKVLPPALVSDAKRRERFLQEARAVAALNHPHICTLHDIGHHDGIDFLVMEHVEGETLRQRLDRGPVAVHEAVEIAIQLAGALAAAHGHRIVHRDIKPENVMLRPEGNVKVLDFGLAKLTEVSPDQVTALRTEPGVVIGTPRYMSPEQTRGLPVDARSDVWSLGIVVYEMLAGRAPFEGGTTADVMAAVLRSDPPLLVVNPSSVSAMLADTLRTALSKDARQRFASAHEMQAALIAVRREIDSAARTTVPRVPAIMRTRLIVLPLRILRPDADTDFLAFSLPDALSTSLARLEPLLVRSSLAAAPLASDSDVCAIAQHHGVDMIVTGTMVRSGAHLRISTQLIDGTSGTLTWSHTADVTLGDLFRLQDSLVEGIVDSLALPLTGSDRRQLHLDVPASPKGYEYYLRANELSQQPKNWTVARDLYRQAVEEDPRFAPAWAHIARLYRLLAKYRREDSSANLARAEDALGKALQLNPDLSIAHRLYAQIDVDRGYAEEAMVRLIVRARDRGDAELFAALVHVCRFCGLMDASVAADTRARAVDPALKTGVDHTFWLLHRYEDALAATSVKAYVFPASLVELGRVEEARTVIADLEERSDNRVPHLAAAVRAFLDGRRADGVKALIAHATTTSVPDPESLFYVGRHLVHVGEPEQGLPFIQRAFEGGHFCYPVLANDPWLNAVRSDPAFQSVLIAARARWQHASAMFVAAGGPFLLGIPSQ
jgi:eukaryotic-like serine/threonine-protein kinase